MVPCRPPRWCLTSICFLLPVLAQASNDDAAFAPLRAAPPGPVSSIAASLGASRFDDTRLSARGDTACSTCHNVRAAPSKGGRDPTSLWNVSLNASFGWTGRFATLPEQIGHELTAHDRLAGTLERARSLLQSNSDYRAAVGKWRGRAPREEDVLEALSAHLHTLLTPGSAFDRYLVGEASLSADALVGLRRFRELGCASCHQGINLGGNLLQRLGLFESYGGADRGREMDTGRNRDRYVFRVPGLRNVANSAPYFHDGSKATLADAIVSMGRLQLMRQLNAKEVAQLSAFLESLSAPLAPLPSDESPAW